MTMQLEIINKLFLELSQVTSATTAREEELEFLHIQAQKRIAELVSVIGDIEQLRFKEGHSVTILCDNPEADSVDKQAVVEIVADFTEWQPKRFYGKTWIEAIHLAANESRRECF